MWAGGCRRLLSTWCPAEGGAGISQWPGRDPEGRGPWPRRGPGLPCSHGPPSSPGQLDREGRSLTPAEDKSVLTLASPLSGWMRFRTSDVSDAAGGCFLSMDHCAKCCLIALPLPLGGCWATAVSEHLLCAGPCWSAPLRQILPVMLPGALPHPQFAGGETEAYVPFPRPAEPCPGLRVHLGLA